MTRSQSLSGDLTYYGKAIPVPNSILCPFSKLIEKWVKNSGEEWTVKRLKSFKVDLIRQKAGLLPVAPWIARSKTSYKGVFGQIQRWSKDHFESALQLCQVYTWFCSGKVTKSQSRKFLDGVRAPLPPKTAISYSLNFVKAGLDVLLTAHPCSLPRARHLLDVMPKESKRAPVPTGTADEYSGILNSLGFIFDNVEGYSHYIRFKEFYEPVVDGFPILDALSKGTMAAPSTKLGYFQVGRIGLIQEPGYKLRAVANPGRVFQRVLEPIGDKCYQTLGQCPWDCTFDQSRGFSTLQEKLRSGNVIYSIDLSGATDYFPIDLQLEVIGRICGKRSADLFKEISQASWHMPGFGMISWNRGQPLGLYPSFGAFALTHGLLLLGLAYGDTLRHQDLDKPWNGLFYILGDDVVITSERLAKRYLRVMRTLGCPVSKDKTIISNSLCEFGGKVITSDSVQPQLNWRCPSDKSFLDIARNLGPRSLCLFRSRQKKVIQSIGLVPEFLGGLGWNPKGLPLEERLNQPWIWKEKSANNLLMSYSSLQVKMLMHSDIVKRILKKGLGFSTQSLIKGDLDQRSAHLVAKHIGTCFTDIYMIMGKNLDQVLMDKGLSHDLPIQGWVGNSPPTTLQLWERLISE